METLKQKSDNCKLLQGISMSILRDFDLKLKEYDKEVYDLFIKLFHENFVKEDGGKYDIWAEMCSFGGSHANIWHGPSLSVMEIDGSDVENLKDFDYQKFLKFLDDQTSSTGCMHYIYKQKISLPREG